MKLPQIQNRAVESVGRHDLGALAVLGSAKAGEGKATQQVLGQMAQAADTYRQRREDAEYNEVVATMKSDMMQWESEYNTKQFYSADELGDISEEAVSRTVTSTDEMGATVTQARNQIPAHEVYPLILQKKLDGMIEEKANKISNSHLRKQFLTTAKPFVADKMMKATIAAEEAQQAYTQRSYEEQAQNAAELQDLDSAIFFIEQMEIDDISKRELIKGAEGIAENAFYSEVIRSTNQESILLARGILTEENYDGALDEAKRQATIKDLDNRFDQLDYEKLAEMSQQHAVTYSDAQAAIDAGQYTNQQIEDGYALWKENPDDPEGFSGQERTALRGRLEAINNRNLTSSNRLALADTILTSGQADPWDADHQKAIDEHVTVNQINDPVALEKIVMDTSIMPQVVENFLNSSAVNGDPQKSTQALEMYGRLVDADAYKVREMGSEAKEIYSDAHILNRGGVDSNKAIEIARENARLAPELKDQRQRDYKALKPDEVNPDALKDFMKNDARNFGFEVSWYQSNIGAIDTMSAEFNNMVAVHYERTGNLAQAQAMAFDTVKETWSPTSIGSWVTGDETEIGKSRPMKYAPERMLNVTPEQADSMLGAFAEKHGLNRDDMIVTSDIKTPRDGSWKIMMIDPDTGLFDSYIDPATSQHLRWHGNEWRQKGKEFAHQQKLDAAIKLRERKEKGRRGRLGVDRPSSPPPEIGSPNPGRQGFMGRGVRQ